MKNLFYKIFNPDKYLKQKQSKIIELDTKIFKEKYEKYINSIQVVLENKNEISFLHSGHIGDIINVLPVIKEISKTHACNLLIELNLPITVNYNNHPAGKFYLDKRIYNMLYPLLKKQSYIKNIDIFNNQSIDINFNLIRELPINLLFDARSY